MARSHEVVAQPEEHGAVSGRIARPHEDVVAPTRAHDVVATVDHDDVIAIGSHDHVIPAAVVDEQSELARRKDREVLQELGFGPGVEVLNAVRRRGLAAALAGSEVGWLLRRSRLRQPEDGQTGDDPGHGSMRLLHDWLPSATTAALSGQDRLGRIRHEARLHVLFMIGSARMGACEYWSSRTTRPWPRSSGVA